MEFNYLNFDKVAGLLIGSFAIGSAIGSLFSSSAMAIGSLIGIIACVVVLVVKELFSS